MTTDKATPPDDIDGALTQLRELYDKATPGRWICDADTYPDDVSIWAEGNEENLLLNVGSDGGTGKPLGVAFDADAHNGNLIVAMKNSLPSLLELLAAQAEKIATLKQDRFGANAEIARLQEIIDSARAPFAKLEAENKRLREAALARSAECTSYRSALMQIKSAQERHIKGEVSPGVPAYKMLECWNIAHKALAQTAELPWLQRHRGG